MPTKRERLDRLRAAIRPSPEPPAEPDHGELSGLMADVERVRRGEPVRGDYSGRRLSPEAFSDYLYDLEELARRTGDDHFVRLGLQHPDGTDVVCGMSEDLYDRSEEQRRAAGGPPHHWFGDRQEGMK